MINSLMQYLNKGTIPTSKLIQIIPKSKYDNELLEYARHCGESTEFEIDRIGQRIEFSCQDRNNAYYYYMTLQINEKASFGNQSKEPFEITIESMEPNWEE